MQLFAHFARAYPRQTLLTVLCLFLGALAEGAGLSTLLVLLVGFLGEDAGGAGSGRVPTSLEEGVRSALAWAGIDPTLGNLLLIFVSANLTQSGMVLLAKRQVGYTVAHVATDLRLGLLRALTAARWNYFTRQPTGFVTNSIASEADRASQAYLYGATIIALAVQALLYATIALTVSWKVTVCAALAGTFTVWIVGGLVGLTRRAGDKQTLVMRSLLGRLTDSLQAVKPLKAMARESLMGPLLEKDTKRLKKAMRTQVLTKEALKAVQTPMTAVFGAIGIYVAKTYWDVPVADMLMLALMFLNAQSRVSKAQRQYQHMMTHDSAVWALKDTIDDANAHREIDSGERPAHIEHGIALDHVSVDYDGKPVLEDVTLDIPAGSITALIGPSGAGKTTLVDLTTGLVRPNRGQVLVDGVPLEEIRLQSWRQQIGYVPQEMFLLNDSIRENVTLGEKVSDAEVRDALDRAGAWEFIAALPEGLDAPVGERGARLSGGQRQRISIARALLHGSRFLILDEATAALDPETEAAVWESLMRLRGDVTILAISHQYALTSVADRIYRVEGGKAQRVDPGALEGEEVA
jgi:ATP-binding cassette subfamily C protein